MASLRSLIETALAGYISNLSLSANVYTGFDTDEKAFPAIICSAASAEEDPQGSGNYRVQCKVEVKDLASSGNFDTLSAAVRDALNISDLNVELSSSTLTVWGQSGPIQLAWETQDDAWVETISVELYAAPTGFGTV